MSAQDIGCYRPGLHYHWHQHIAGGAHCAECARLVFSAWLRCADSRPVCDDCYLGKEP